MSKKEITELYRSFRKANCNRKPDRAIVLITWDDDEEKVPVKDCIALEEFNMQDDDDSILFYTKGLNGLLELTNPNNGSEFVVTKVESFYKHKR